MSATDEMHYRKSIKRLIAEMKSEADNLSPTNQVHPAPTILKWAQRLEAILRDIP